MASSTPTTATTSTDHASLLARISALEQENKLLRESLKKQQSDAPDTSKIYFDGFRTRLDTEDNESWANAAVDLPESPHSLNMSRSYTDGVCFNLDKSNRFASLQLDMNDMSLEDIDLESEHDEEVDHWKRVKSVTQSVRCFNRMASSKSLPEQQERYTATSLRSETISRAVELRKTLNVLHTMLTHKTMKSFDSSSDVQKQCFAVFYLLSVNLGGARQPSDWIERGCRFLDPLILQYGDCVDQYPMNVKGGMSTNELSMFCLLGGLKIKLVPKVVEKLGWMEEIDYKVLVVSVMYVVSLSFAIHIIFRLANHLILVVLTISSQMGKE
jgi:hypothetical protein